jgi:predicted nucleic acid-binding protein
VIVVDSSVWIDFFRGRTTEQVDLLARMLGRELLLVPDLVLCEVLRGASSDEQAGELLAILQDFDVVAVVDASVAVIAAANFRELRGRGVRLRSVPDLLIGTWCIERDHHLLHRDRDRDFDAMERHLGLKVLGA